MKKGLLLILLGIVVVIFGVADVQAETGSTYAIDSFTADAGMSGFNPLAIDKKNSSSVTEELILTQATKKKTTAKKKTAAKRKKAAAKKKTAAKKKRGGKKKTAKK